MIAEPGLDFLFLPHQLVEPEGLISNGPTPNHPISNGTIPNHPISNRPTPTAWIVEEWLFFGQFDFHRQKLIHQRACMKVFAEELHQKGWTVNYVDSADPHSDIRAFLDHNAHHLTGSTLHLYECGDQWLEQRIRRSAQKHGITLNWLPNPLFLDRPLVSDSWFKGKKRFLQADYYRKQRIRHQILLEPKSNEDRSPSTEPLGGQWSYDEENRKRYPAQGNPPPPPPIMVHPAWEEATQYTRQHYPNAPGAEKGDWTWPITRNDAQIWLKSFLQERFKDFGPYEDALDHRHRLLHHSAISPLLNNGLLRTEDVLRQSLDHAQRHQTSLPSIEGWVRQILGWREFIHGVYQHAGSKQRTRNFWGFERDMPPSFYNASTGIEPVDHSIRSLLQNAYNHHIERLMVLSNFMLLCEIHPDAVYRWFMEMYIDAYDWVMVPNVYGMGQFADGGLMSTKPYLSSSNYILKMSNFRADSSWTEPWDALYWRFMSTHREFFLRNPRSAMMIRQWDRKDPSQQQILLERAELFLNRLHGNSNKP
ncbi:MAG: cryptochrome/photolyase family protein [Bacteroidetes bacterium]|nr:cryptochrome/photolyase family protein [Bacteroidota bacterium]